MNWGVKSPRLCLPNLFNSFASIASEFVDEVKLIMCDRDFEGILQCHLDEISGYSKPHKYTDEYIFDYITYWYDLSSKVYKRFNGEKLMVQFDDAAINPSYFLMLLSEFTGLALTDDARDFIYRRIESLNGN